MWRRGPVSTGEWMILGALILLLGLFAYILFG
jgi:hypothetical protein